MPHFCAALLLDRLQIKRKFQHPAARNRFCIHDGISADFRAEAVPEDRHRAAMSADHCTSVNRPDHVKHRKDAAISFCYSGKVGNGVPEQRCNLAFSVGRRAMTRGAGHKEFFLPGRELLSGILRQHCGRTKNAGRRQDPGFEHCLYP